MRQQPLALVALWMFTLAAGPGVAVALAQPSDPALVERARKILDRVPLVDGHNDAPWVVRERFGTHLDRFDLAKDLSAVQPAVHTDIARLRQGGVGGQFWSVYVPVELTGATAVTVTLEQIDIVRRFTAKYPQTFEMAWSAADVRRIHKAGRIASLIGMEGGHSIDNSLGVLRQMYQTGARYMTLTHTKNTDWADSATDEPKHGGLSPFGEEVVREMNRLGMLVDLSHVAPETMKKALAVSQAPVIFSHSSARALADHPRNVPDDVLRLLAANGGVVMVTFVPGFDSAEVRAWNAERSAAEARAKSLAPGAAEPVKQAVEAWEKAHPAPRATVAQVADHIEHVRRLAGIDHVGLGSDFDGIPTTPLGLESVARYPVLLAELLRRGWSEEEIGKLAGLNVLAAFEQAERVAGRLQKERPPSDARFADFAAKPQDK